MQPTTNLLLTVCPYTSMALGHDSLAKIAKKEGYPVEKLEPGHFILFLNKARTAYKLYAANGILIYYKHPRPLDLQTLALIPHFFIGNKFSYPAAFLARMQKSYPELKYNHTTPPKVIKRKK